MDHEERDVQIPYDFERVEQPSADQMDRHAREGDARQIGQVGERRLKNESVEWMAADDLRRDRAAEGVAVENRGNVFWTDSLVQPGRGDAVVDDPGERRRAGASAEAAIVEQQDVDAGVEQVRHDVGGGGEIAGVAVAVER